MSVRVVGADVEDADWARLFGDHGDRAGRLVILGTSGWGRTLVSLVEALNRWGASIELLGMIDDDPQDLDLLEPINTTFLGGLDLLDGLDASFVLGSTDIAQRRLHDRRATSAGLEAMTLIHPETALGPDFTVGQGSVIIESRLSIGVTLGRHCVIEDTRVGHDVVLDDFAWVENGNTLGGDARIGNGAVLGIGAVVASGISVGSDAVIRGGTVLDSDVPNGAHVRGLPGSLDREA